MDNKKENAFKIIADEKKRLIALAESSSSSSAVAIGSLSAPSSAAASSLSSLLTSLSSNEKELSIFDEEIKIYKCEPTYWLFLPKPIRLILGWITLIIFCSTYFVIPMMLIFLFPFMWSSLFRKKVSSFILLIIFISFMLPQKEWIWFRNIGQLWYDYY